ncbi:hypothetical protein KAH37_10360 [bacterium]|nr:hypothetical protein [bacterium]
MKKLFLVAALMSALFLISCGDNTVDTGDSADDTGDSADDTGDTTTDVGDTTTDEADSADDSADTAADEADTVEDSDVSDTADTTTDDDGSDTGAETCTEEGTSQLSSEICGSTQHGRLYQTCTSGVWVKTDVCSCDPGEYPEVCGYYAQKMWFTANSKVATIDMAEGWTRTYFLVYQEQRGEKISMVSKVCHVKLGNSMSGTVNPQTPPSYAEALPLLMKSATLTKESDDSFSYFQDWFYEIRSVDPTCVIDPATYVLPTDKNDACVQDWDADGVPGILVIVKGTMSGDTHIVENSATKLQGMVLEDGVKLGGTVEWTDVQNVLVTDNFLLKSGAQNALKEGSPNTWEQVLLDTKVDCQYIIDNAKTLFSADPVELK